MTMLIIRGMSTHQVMSTTTTLATRIGSPRLSHIARRNAHIVSGGCYEKKQGTEILHESENNIHEISESQQEIADYKLVESVISYDALYESLLKCRKNVSWKPSVKQVLLNASREILNMHDKLVNGTRVNSKQKPVEIYYPKRRTALSIPFKDRIYQRSINDNILYPEMTKHFIHANCACQRGKGTDYAMNLVRLYLRRFYARNGLNGYVLQMDLTKYYYTIVHDKANNDIRRYNSPMIADMIIDVLDCQHSGEYGYDPGSQMVQIIGISHINDVDHFIKEDLGIKEYIRYNDDFLLFHESYEYLVYCYEQIANRLTQKGLKISENKTEIFKISKEFIFLGFKWRLTNTGKVLCFVKSESVKHERKKLYRLVSKSDKEKADECYQSWKAHAERGNCFKLFKRLDNYYFNLWEHKI